MLYLDYAREEGEWSPNEHGGRENLEAVKLLQETNATAYRRNPGTVTIAEESTSWPGVTPPTAPTAWASASSGTWAGCTTRWTTSRASPSTAVHHHGEMTFAMVYAWTEKFVLPISHDEVVHGKGSLLRKMPGDRWEQLANVRAYVANMSVHPGKQLLFMGSRSSRRRPSGPNRAQPGLVAARPAGALGCARPGQGLNRLYAAPRAVWELDNEPRGLRAGSTLMTATGTRSPTCGFGGRRATDDVVAVVVNSSAVPSTAAYCIGLPHGGHLERGAQHRRAGLRRRWPRQPRQCHRRARSPAHGQPYSAVMTLPPLATLWFRRRP